MLKATEFPFRQMHQSLVIQVKLILPLVLLMYIIFSRCFHLFYYLFFFVILTITYICNIQRL